MNKLKHLQKAHALLERKVKNSEFKKRQSLKSLDDLQQKKQLLDEARQTCSTKTGDRMSSLSCWSRDGFVQLLGRVSMLVEQEVIKEGQRVEAIQNQLDKDSLQKKGIEYLNDKLYQETLDSHLKQEQFEVEDRLQSSQS